MKNLKELNLSKYSITPDGSVYSHYSNRFLKNYKGTDGYYRLTLITDDGETKYYRVNRLVALVYCAGFTEDKVVNHKDGNKLNNLFSNLEWVSVSENTIHAIQNELQTKVGGYDISSIEVVHEVCRMLEQGYRNSDISTILNISTTRIQEIKNKTHFKFISDEYDINYVKKSNRISLEKVLAICKDLQYGLNLCQVSVKHQVGTSTVHRIRQRKTYSDISKNFRW